MSFHRPKCTPSCTPSPSKHPPSSSSLSTNTPHNHHLINVSDILKLKCAPRTSSLSFVDPQYVVALPTRVHLNQAPLPHRLPPPHQQPTFATPDPYPDDPFSSLIETPGYHDVMGGILTTHAPLSDLHWLQRQRLKKSKQWSTWANEIVPSLLAPYLHLLRETQSLHT